MSTRIITLLTDFGTEDYFVGAMKGVILTRTSRAVLVDITHAIPHQNLEAAAFTLNAAYSCFPAGSIHLAVVDPGVGSDRRPILIEAGLHLFVGPDNGLFTFVLDQFPTARIRHLTNSAYFLANPGTTFHGRDIFAPVAASLAKGVAPAKFGPIVQDPVRLEAARFASLPDGSLTGKIIHIDHFGNCITNLPADLFPTTSETRRFVLQVKDCAVRTVERSYQAGAQQASQPFLIRGSAGFVEISLSSASAARTIGIRVGDPVHLCWNK